MYRPADGYDATAGGISAACDRLTIVGVIDNRGRFVGSPHESCVFAPDDEGAPAAALRRIRDSAHIVYIDGYGQPFGGLMVMAGGNFAATTDSRLADYFRLLGLEPFYGAVPIHDRLER